MTNRAQNIALGAALMALAAVWTWLVIDTIPPGFGDGEIGARAFPLTFGIALLVLAAILLARTVLSSDIKSEGPIDAELPAPDGLKWFPAASLLAEIALYGFLLEKIGFVLATPIVVLLVMVVNLRVHSPVKLVAMPLGLTVGCWLIFEKVLGVYLANGTWMNLG